MDIPALIRSGDNTEAYALFQSLLERSRENNALYDEFDSLLPLLGDKSAYVRIRAFSLLCAQARWDTEGKLSRSLPELLACLADPRPIAVRKYLPALGEIASYRPELRAQLRSAVESLDLSRFKNSMRPLIEKDILALLSLL